MRAIATPNPFLFVRIANGKEESMRTITRTTTVIVVLLTIAALSAVAQESTGEKIKHGAQKAGEKVKEAAKTVGEKTKELWKDTKAYASSDTKAYRKGARQKLNDLKSEITELKGRKSEA